jgi:hypothetical protein
MPLPKPKENEKEQEFVSRCMGSETMNKEFPDQKQRAAVCYSQYKKRKQTSKAGEEPAWEDCEGDNTLTLL